MSLLPKYIFDDNVIRPRSSFTKIKGLNFIIKGHSALFDKKFGAPCKIHWSTPRIRRMERAANSSRHHIAIVQQFNDCLLLKKMQAIVESSYFFGSDLQKQTTRFLLRKTNSYTYQYIRTLIGLPCNGQRTKTNAQTCKKKRSLEPHIIKILTKISVQQSEEKNSHAKSISATRSEIQKFRILKDLMRQKRYRPSSKIIDVKQHYENVYKRIINTKKQRKSKNN